MEALLALLLTLTPWYGDKDEAPEDRKARLTLVAKAVRKASARATCTDQPKPAKGAKAKKCQRIWHGDRDRLEATLVMLANQESGYARFVQDGSCNRDPKLRKRWCDSGRAASVWQLQSGYRLTVERWRKMIGMTQDAHDRAAWRAAESLSRGVTFCGHLRGAIALYATGRRCVWSRAKKREQLGQAMTVKYRAIIKGQKRDRSAPRRRKPAESRVAQR